MLDQSYNVPQQARAILGDLTALAVQLGSVDGLSELSMAASCLGSARLRSITELERFLEGYTTGVMIPHDLPAVAQAFRHATHGEVRELILLDNQLSQTRSLEQFASASCHVGSTQLRRLRPLRGERVVQRYLQALEVGEAKGWHTLVFGLVLSVYSLPLRQGLVHYAQQTLGGFVQAASHRITLPPAQVERFLSGQIQPIGTAVEAVIAQHAAGPLDRC
jgi:urease accessory protein UreF